MKDSTMAPLFATLFSAAASVASIQQQIGLQHQRVTEESLPFVVRIRTLQSDFGEETDWMLQHVEGDMPATDGLCHTPNTTCPGFTATEVLAIIEKLRPTQLERFTSGRINMTASVPVDEGQQPISVREFLDASQARLAPGGEITVRASLNEWCCGSALCPHCNVDPEHCCNPTPNSTENFLATTQQTFTAGAQLKVPFTTVGIDNWSGSCHAEPDAVEALLNAVRKQGWKHIAVNEVGGVCDSHKLADTAEFGIDQDALTNRAEVVPKWDALARIKAAGIPNAALYIDFPGAYALFDQLPVDARAAALVNITNLQMAHNFSFVYAVVQGHCGLGKCNVLCDTTRAMTTASGPYQGKSLLEVIREAVRRNDS